LLISGLAIRITLIEQFFDPSFSPGLLTPKGLQTREMAHFGVSV
jgi:hypothetical protein